jgi:GTP cyclohydrolase I/GTP cyclohydrolase-4
MVRGVIETYSDIADAAFLSAGQVNLETIHQHNVVAERFGTFGEIRRELKSGAQSPEHTSRRKWLDAVP